MSPLRNHFSAAAPARRIVGWLVFAVAVGFHAGYVYDLRTQLNHGLWDYHVVQGMSFGDALTWHEMGFEIGHGWGWNQWRARRPLYGWFLGVLYTLVHDAAAYDAALACNVALTAISAALIYAAIARLFGVTVAVCAAGALVFDRQTLLCSATTLSEALGLALLAGHFWLLVVASQERRMAPLAASGVLFALSNAARTLTLFAAPLYVVVLVWNFRSAGADWRKGLGAAVAFGLPAALVTAGFMTQNYLRVGIFALSDNTAWDLYAVTAPEYGEWTPEVHAHMNQKLNLWGEKEIYDYQMQQARANIRQHPRLFLTRVARNIANTAKTLLTLGTNWLWVFWGIAWLSWPDNSASDRWRRRGYGLLPVLAAYSAMARGLLLLGALALALSGKPRREARLLAVLLLGTLVAVGMFGSRMERLFVLFQWSYVAVMLAAIGQFLAWTRGRTLVGDEPESLPSFPALNFGGGPYRLLGGVLAMFVCLVVYRNTAAMQPWVARDDLQSTLTRLAQTAILRAPHLFSAAERDVMRPSSTAPCALPEHVFGPHGEMAAICGKVAGVYYFPALSPFQVGLDSHIKPRTYAFTLLRVAHRNPAGAMNVASCVFPGDLRSLIGRQVCVLGRVNNLEITTAYAEGVAWCPWTGDSPQADVRAVRFAGDEAGHDDLLRKFVAAPPLPAAR